MDKATDKQVKFVIGLIQEYYFGDPEKRERLTAIVSNTDKLSKRDAAKLERRLALYNALTKHDHPNF